MNVDDSMEIVMFEEWLLSRNLSQSTTYIYVCGAKKFLLTNPNLDDVESYNNFLFEFSIKKRSLVYYDALKLFIKFKFDSDKNKRNILLRNLIFCKEPDPIRTRKSLDAETKEQVIKLIKDYKHRVIARLQNVTGVRASDVLRLKRGSISYEAYDDKTVVMRIDFLGKGGKRFVKWVFDDNVMNMIDLYIKGTLIDSEYYFLDRNISRAGGNEYLIFRTNYHRYWEDLKQALTTLGINYKDWATHDFRRSFARSVWDKTKDPYLLKESLNHTDFNTTVRYLRTSGLNTRDLYYELSEGNKKK